MADIKKTIEIIFGATDDTRSVVNNIASGIGGLEQSVGSVTGPLASLTGSLFKTEGAILAVGAAYGAFAISKAIDFQTAQNDLKKVLDETDPSIESFTDTVFDLSEQYGLSASSVIQGVADFKQAGFTANEAASLQKDALDLVIAGDIDAAHSSELLITSLKGFGAEAKEASRFTEAINNVTQKYATNVNELSSGVSRLSPIAKAMGFTFEETTGLVTPIVEVFRSGDEAANALRTGLLSLTSQEKRVQDELKKLGVAQFDVNGEMRTGKDIFFDVGKALSGLSENQKQVSVQQLVGKDRTAQVVQVFSNLGKVSEITAVAMEKTGSVQKEVNIVLDSAEKQIDRTKIAFDNLGISVGDKLLSGFTDVNSGARDLIASLRGIVDKGGLDTLFNAVKLEGKNFGDILSGIAKALPDAVEGLKFDGLADDFKRLRESVGGLFGDLDLTNPEDLKELLQGLIDFVGSLTRTTAGAVKGFEPLIDAIKKGIDAYNDLSDEAKESSGEFLALSTTIDALLPGLGFLSDALALVGAALGVLGGAAVVNAFKTIATGLKGITPVAAAATAAIGAVGFAVTKNITAYEDYEKTQRTIAESIEDTSITLANQKIKLAFISAQTGVAIKTMDDFNKALDDGTIAIDDLSNGYISGSEALARKTAALDESKPKIKDNTVLTEQLGEKTFDAATLLNKFNAATEDGKLKLERKTDALDENKEATDKLKDRTEKLAEEEKNVAKQTQLVEEKLTKLARNKEIAEIEFTAKLKADKIEEEAKKIKDFFDSISKSIKSRNELISDLFGDSEVSIFDTPKRDAIREAQEQAEKLNNSQIALIDAQTKSLRAQTKSLESGGSLITINADDLAPELQQVLKSLIDNIRIEALNNGLGILQ